MSRRKKLPRVMKTLMVENYMGDQRRVRILASSGMFALHRGAFPIDRPYVVTHLPTRLAAARRLQTVAAGRVVLRACQSIPGDWSFTDPSLASKRQQRAVRRLRKQFHQELE